MAKNSLVDLNNHLFEQLERLNDDDALQGDNLDREIRRSKAMTGIAQQVINNASLALTAKKYVDEYGDNAVVPEMLGIAEKNIK